MKKSILLSGLLFGLIFVVYTKSFSKNYHSHNTGHLINIKSYADSIVEFERRIYFEIDKLYTGRTYIDKNNSNVFYRVLVIPEEENIMLIAEKISFGDEGGNFKLVKLSRITDDGSVLPKFGLSSAESIKFVDSVRIQGLFNGKKMIINLEKLKKYHP